MTHSSARYLDAMEIVRWRLRSSQRPAVGQGSTGGGDAAVSPGRGPEARAAPVGVAAGADPPTQRARCPDDAAIGTLDWTLLEQTVATCRRCALHRHRRQTVFGTGSPEAEWMFVGEAPGAEEDRRGEPFVGRAGKLLDAMLATVGRSREQVYIANVLKCRPPDNRDPQGEEVGQCGAYLLRQIDLVQPRLLIAMGRFAAQALLQSTRPISKLRGQVFEHAASGTPLVVTYHPAYLLRNPLDKRKAWQDLCLMRQVSESP